MKKSLLFLLFFTITIVGIGQPNFDSLQQVWENQDLPESERFEAGLQLTRQIGLFRPDSGLARARHLLDLAEKKGLKYYQGRAIREEGIIFMNRGDLSNAMDNFHKSAEIFEDTGKKMDLAHVWLGFANIYIAHKNFEEATRYSEQALEVYRESEAPKFIAHGLMSLGNVYARQEKYPQAIEYYSECLDIRRQIPGEEKNVAAILNNLGIISLREDNYDQALKYYVESLEIEKRINSRDFKSIAGSLINIGDILHRQCHCNHNKAIPYYEKAINMLEEIGEKGFLANAYVGLGGIQQEEGDYKKAKDHYIQALNLYREMGSKDYESNALSSLARLHFELEEYEQAISYGEQALALAKDLRGVRSISQFLSRVYKETGNYKKALEMSYKHNSIRDSIDFAENHRASVEQAAKYEYEKQKALDDFAFEQEKIRQQYISTGIGVGLLLASIIAFLLFRNLRATRREKALTELAKEKAEQSERFKERFLANMSHEIRTPMHAISGMLNILQRNEPAPAQTSYLEAMSTSAQNLLVILNDVLDLSKIEAGKLHIEKVAMSPAAVAQQVVDIMKYKADDKSLDLNLTVSEDFPQSAMGDPTRLNQILTNLVGNAIKFTHKGNVTLNLGRNGDQMIFTITDTGIGIPKDKLQTIFGSFEQADVSTTRDYGGTGLGLSITRQLVELQEGKIDIESKVGKGSTFTVTLPLIKSETTETVRTSVPEEQLKAMGAEMKGLKVLLADDDAFNLIVVREDLKWYIPEVQIDMVKNGLEAVEAYQQGDYDIILMDMHMPGMHGHEATQKIRGLEEEGKTAVPIIALTASLLETEIQRSFDSGMSGYIPKPYQLEQLVGGVYEEVRKRL
jgi:signal transduction histidine kinase/CheY-like chemotaxis protein